MRFLVRRGKFPPSQYRRFALLPRRVGPEIVWLERFTDTDMINEALRRLLAMSDEEFDRATAGYRWEALWDGVWAALHPQLQKPLPRKAAKPSLWRRIVR